MKLPWIQVESKDQLIENLAKKQLVYKLFFKHSTRCIISSMALKMFEREWHTDNITVELFFIDLIQFRSVSDELSHLSGVEHQSPQVIVFENNHVIYHASHNNINADQILKLIKDV